MAAEKLRERAHTLTLAYPIRLLEAGARVEDAERDPVRILEAVFKGPEAVARESLIHHGGVAYGTLTVIRPWLFKRPGRPRAIWEAPLAEYDALRKAGKPAAVAAREVAKRHEEDVASVEDGGWTARRWIKNLQDRRRRAVRRSAAK